MDIFAVATGIVAFELSLFAAVIFLLFGIEDLVVDILWMGLVAVQRVDRRSVVAPAPFRQPPRHFAVAIPAWREAAVIGAMLANLRRRWPHDDIRIVVGVYPNDIGTMLAALRAARNDPRIRLAINARPGPTTKGDCLNRIWRAIREEAEAGGFTADALLIHDAEDVVDAQELAVLGAALTTHDYAQLPVIPLMAAKDHWVGRHYCDEFAEAHGKEMPVRSAIGAPLPTAGVGCAFTMAALRRLDSGDGPFCADCLTEDYELGVRLARIGARGVFVRRRDGDGRLVASRALFPARIDDSVKQKTRWLRGIALDGWDRLGWPVGRGALMQRALGIWMLWRDRRVVLAAAAIACGYAALALALAGWAMDTPMPVVERWVGWLLIANLALLLWRLAMRGWQTARVYGPAQGGMAVLRQPVSNIILIMTAWRALFGYVRQRKGQIPVWDKTDHLFPAE
jgi:bacteriophage N4 adsorption protein B